MLHSLDCLSVRSLHLTAASLHITESSMAFLRCGYLRVTNYDHFTTSLISIGLNSIKLLKDILGGADWINILFDWRPVLFDVLIAGKPWCRWTLRLLLSSCIRNFEGLVSIRLSWLLLTLRYLNWCGTTIIIHRCLNVLSNFRLIWLVHCRVSLSCIIFLVTHIISGCSSFAKYFLLVKNCVTKLFIKELVWHDLADSMPQNWEL